MNNRMLKAPCLCHDSKFCILESVMCATTIYELDVDNLIYSVAVYHLLHLYRASLRPSKPQSQYFVISFRYAPHQTPITRFFRP